MKLSQEQIGQCLKLRMNYLNKLRPLLQHRLEINQTLRQSFGPVLGESFSGTDLNSARIMVQSPSSRILIEFQCANFLLLCVEASLYPCARGGFILHHRGGRVFAGT